MPDPNHEKLLAAALTLLERLPERSVAPNSAAIYLRVFQRMLEVGSGACQPLRPGMCRDTYGVARAALHYGARLQLGALATKLEGSVPGADPSETERAGEALIVAARRLWPVLAQHPPARGGDYNTQSPWSALQTAQPPFRGAGSKKRDLPRLADEAGDADWRDLVWAAASGRSGYHSATAALSVSPFRPGEYVPSLRNGVLWPGVWVRLISGDRLTLFTRPTKTRNGVFGTELAGVILGLDCAGAQAHFLAERCREQGGAMVVAVQSADCLRKAVERSGAAALSSATITPYTYRHQCLADLKRVFGSGENVAAGAGHRSNKSQRRYASRTQGRSSRGLLQVFNRDHPDLAELIGETAYSVLSKRTSICREMPALRAGVPSAPETTNDGSAPVGLMPAAEVDPTETNDLGWSAFGL